MDKVLGQMLDAVSGGNAEDRQKGLDALDATWHSSGEMSTSVYAALDASCGGDDTRWKAGFDVFKQSVEEVLTKMAPSGSGGATGIIQKAEEKGGQLIQGAKSALSSKRTDKPKG